MMKQSHYLVIGVILLIYFMSMNKGYSSGYESRSQAIVDAHKILVEKAICPDCKQRYSFYMNKGKSGYTCPCG